MRKIIAILLCFVLVLSFAACGSTEEAPTTQPTTEPTTQPTEPPYVFDPVVLVDNEDICLTVTDYTPGMDNDCLSLEFQNKTDKKLQVSFKNTSINGLMFPVAFSAFAAPKETITDTCFLSWEELQVTGIPSVSQFEFTVCVLDADNYAEDPLLEDTFCVYPYGEDKAVDFVRESTQNEITVVDNDSCTIIIMKTYPGENDDYKLTLYLQNKTDLTLSFTAEDAKLNGVDCDPLWILNVAPGKQAISVVTWETAALEKAGITTVENILLELRVSDADDWRANAIFTDEIEFKPF